MNNSELASNIIKKIEDPIEPLWFPSITDRFVEAGGEALYRKCQLQLSDYGTNRMWFCNKNAQRDIITNMTHPFKESSLPIHIEVLEQELVEKYHESGVSFFEAYEIAETSVMNCLNEAVDLIKYVPSLLDSIFALVRSLHLIKLEDDEYDISFSEPHIPFSIFVSIPKARIENDYLRVAEAIIHEAMHLQLTLIEKITPLVVNSNDKYYSPWKEEYRTIEGVLHALYVFGTFDSFLEKLLDYASLSSSERNYLVNRRRLISQQISCVQDFVNCPKLTNLGEFFADRLIKI
jgi:hypothetical protein